MTAGKSSLSLLRLFPTAWLATFAGALKPPGPKGNSDKRKSGNEQCTAEDRRTLAICYSIFIVVHVRIFVCVYMYIYTSAGDEYDSSRFYSSF